MPQLANILHDGSTSTQVPCHSVTPPTRTASGSSQAGRGFTRYPQWVDAAIAQHAPRPWVRLVATRLFLELLARADHQTHVTRLVTQAQLAHALQVSVDSVQRATTVLRATGACTTIPVYVQRRRVGMRYRMQVEAPSKTADTGSQDLEDLRTSTKSSSVLRTPPAPPPAATVCPMTDTPWLFDAPVRAEKGEACPRCPCHAPPPVLLELEPEPAPGPQRELPLEPEPRPTAPKPSDGQLRLPAYELLNQQPALSDDGLLAQWVPIIAVRYVGARVPAERFTRQLPIVRQRHDPTYHQKQHRRRMGHTARPDERARRLQREWAQNAAMWRQASLATCPDIEQDAVVRALRDRQRRVACG